MRVTFRNTTYDIESDHLSWRVAVVDQNPKGEEYLRDHTYHIRVEDMADYLLQRSLRTADAKDLQALSSLAFELRGEIRKAFDL